MVLHNIEYFNREKYQTVEEETAEGSKKVKKQLYTVRKRVEETMEEAQKVEILQKACEYIYRAELYWNNLADLLM